MKQKLENKKNSRNFPLKFKKHQHLKKFQNIDIDNTLGCNFLHGKCKKYPKIMRRE